MLYHCGLLNDYGLLFVMAWLPNANSRAVRLDLIDVPPLNPDVLRLLDGLLYDYGLGDNRLLNDNGLLNDRRCRYDCRGGLHNDGLGIIRARQRRPYHATNDSTDEARPEVATAAPPIAAVMAIAAMPAVMNRRRTMPPSMTPRTTGTRQTRSGAHNRRERNYNCFSFSHFVPPYY